MSKMWKEKNDPISVILLINNTKEPLQPYLGLTMGGAPSIDQLYIFEGYPSQKEMNKFLSNWIKKLSHSHA